MPPMRAEQLCFFKFPRPLLERFGRDFFRQVPKSPGVYVFMGESRRFLYVGQSKNLRERLRYYKNAQPEREPKRIIRLVHQTVGIELECCQSVESARLRELALIGQHRPRFNIANTLSPTYTYFGLRQSPSGFSIRTTLTALPHHDEDFIGAFRNRGLCGRALCAMARTLVAREGKIRSIFDFPAWLHVRSSQCESHDPEARATVESFLRGDDGTLVEWTGALIANETDPFLRQVLEGDILTLTEFFDLAKEMNRARAFHEAPILSREALQVSGFQLRQQQLGNRMANEV